MRDDFAVFILTHGRADNMATAKMLKKTNYTGKIYFIIDNEDEQAERYKSVIEKAAKKHGKGSSGKGKWIYPGTKLTIP